MSGAAAANGESDRTFERRRPVLVLGLGNEILGDDAVGLLASRHLAARLGDSADHAEACVATLDLLPLVAGYRRVIVVDAYLSPTVPPGTAVRATPAGLPAGFGYRSVHTLPFLDMLALGRSCGLPMPAEVVIHGLCVQEVSTFGHRLSPGVEERWRPWAEEIARVEFGA